MLTDHDKTYRAVLLLGTETDTEDTTGTVIGTKDTSGLTESQVREAVLSFTGDYDQVPPMYSALKVDGKKLYELAREERPWSGRRAGKDLRYSDRDDGSPGGHNDRVLLKGNVYPDPVP